MSPPPTATALPEVLLLQMPAFEDARGFLLQTYDQQALDRAVGAPVRFVQDFQSHSGRHVLRGLHYQLAPHAQGKLLRVAQGRIFDVTVDLRAGSPRFGHWAGVELTADGRQQLWIPPGFAHGFLVLSDGADVIYKTTAPYAPAAERALRWDDPALGIAWPVPGLQPVLSDRDRNALSMAEAPTIIL